jgi:hypothetical protein
MQITKLVQQLPYEGPPLTLAGAGFLANVTRICRVSDSGTGFVSFVGGDFPPFTQLLDGEIYLFYSKTVPYVVPTVASDTQAGVLVLDSSSVSAQDTSYVSEETSWPTAVQAVPAISPPGAGQLAISYDLVNYEVVPSAGVQIPANTFFSLKMSFAAGQFFHATLTCNPL